MVPKIVWVLSLLVGALLLGSLWQGQAGPPFPTFPVTESNSRRTEPVSLRDFVPFGMCWDDQNTLIFHSSMNIGGSHFRLMFNKGRFYRFLTGPSCYDGSGRYFPFPTVHLNPTRNPVLNAIAYDERTRSWYHKILDLRTDPPTEILVVKGRGRLAPLWIGKPEGPFVVHGVAGIQEGWRIQRPWWDPEGEAAWGRSFVKWRGTIALGDETIPVEGVPGFGEFMRYKAEGGS